MLDTFVHEGIEYGIIGDFEKGEAAGSATALHVISQTAQLWEGLQRQQFIAE